MDEFINRILAKYDSTIAELESINEDNKAIVNEAKKRPDTPDARGWARLSRENGSRLQIAKAERYSLKDNYVKD